MKKYIAEFIGTFVLVLVACGVAAVTGCAVPEAGYIATALAFGLVIVAMAYSIGHISGCHVNPAVSLGMLICKKMSVKDFIGYVVAQFLGAIAGAAVLKYIVSGLTENSGIPETAQNLGSNGLFDGDILKSLIIEVILTFVFVLAILGVTAKVESSKLAGLVIGLSLTLVHLIGIPLTGTSVNPARSFGPALLSGNADNLACVWVFIVAPLVGGALAALCWKLLANKTITEE